MASLKTRIEKLESKVKAVENSCLPLKGGVISGSLTVKGNVSSGGAFQNNSTRTHLKGLSSGYNHVLTVGGKKPEDNVMVFNKKKKTLQFLYRLLVNTIKTKSIETKTLSASGKISAKTLSVSGTKNFVIDHPLDREKKELVHASLEGPEAGVYYRGTGKLSDGRIEIKLPDYFEALVRKEGRTVMLTPICDGDNPVSMLAASEVRDGVFTVQYIDNKNCSQRFYWEVKAIRGDIPELVVNRKKQFAELAH
ncbi:hypothetical protein [uncultured Gimesia sp.]|uniref:hypothetical protein n=1 Tax=uncultured Gimesia sp. TaxID=1678688 RepID=UPI0030DB78FA|tara:strand:- start:91785 stop:92537 length:753 start_codon:yes stop_codon:yes gene_type:complete